jgi:hypothetical protein
VEARVKYLCLIYTDENRLDALSADEHDAVTSECLRYEQRLLQSGHLLAVEALRPTHMATSVRVRDGSVNITDGPFAETKEQLAGFFLIEARDLNDAIRIAAKIPPARLGGVEVRPVRHLV